MISKRKYKNSKLMFYLRGISGLAIPRSYFRARLDSLLRDVPERARASVEDRVSYYLKKDTDFVVSDQGRRLSEIPPNKNSAYYFDLRRVVRYFPDRARFDYEFGDVVHVPDVPTFVKTRPLGTENQNSVLLKLNTPRHFLRTRDRTEYESKKDEVLWRGTAHTAPRDAFIERYHARPGFDVGQTNADDGADPARVKPFMSIPDQLQYKFIMSIEGNDVASNLKWIMSSNSVCFMPAPRNESWFMEGRLIPGEHFVQVKDDFSDVEEKVRALLERPEESRRIIANARAHSAQFSDAGLERLVSLKVLEKYFRLSGQL
jgi:hypothetical protein